MEIKNRYSKTKDKEEDNMYNDDNSTIKERVIMAKEKLSQLQKIIDMIEKNNKNKEIVVEVEKKWHWNL